MKHFLVSIVIFTVLMGSSSCSEIKIQKDGAGDGYDVYRPEPYLLVWYEITDQTTETTGNGAVLEGGGGSGSTPSPSTPDTGSPSASPGSASSGSQPLEGMNAPGAVIIWLPNFSVRYRVSTHTFLAKAGAQINIRDGWQLTSIGDQGDSSGVIAAAGQVLAAVPSLFAPAPAKQPPSTGPHALLGSKVTITKHQEWHLFKFIYDANGNFFGLVEVNADPNLANTLNNSRGTPSMNASKDPPSAR